VAKVILEFAGLSLRMIFTSWRTHFRETLLLAIPVCLSNIGHMGVDLADTYFIGKLPEHTEGQAAIALAGAFYVTFLVMAIGVSYGLTPLVAEAQAQQKTERIGNLLRHSIILNIVTSLILVLMLLAINPMLGKLGQPEAVVRLAVPFLGVILLSMIPLSIFFSFKQFAEGMSDTRMAMYITLGSNALNILLNYVLVFGHWGFPAMGMMGSCWATFIARCGMGLAMWFYVRYAARYAIYREGFRFKNLEWSYFKELLKIGVPSGLMFVIEVVAFSMPATFIGQLGADHLAAHRIALSLASMTYMISSGLGAAATIRVGHFLGMGEREQVRRAGFSAMGLALVFMILAAIVFVLFSKELPAFFNEDYTVLEIAAPLFFIAAIFQVFDGLQVTAQGALRGVQDMVVPGFIAAISYWLIGLLLSYLLCFEAGLGVMGVWFGYVAGLFAAATGLVWRFYIKTR
jgi:multidrug resistance protein, MATE family